MLVGTKVVDEVEVIKDVAPGNNQALRYAAMVLSESNAQAGSLDLEGRMKKGGTLLHGEKAAIPGIAMVLAVLERN